MSPITPPKSMTSLSTPSSTPTRLPVRQKGSLTIPPLPKLPLPPLPEITNPAIRRLALTHSSNHSGQSSRKRDLIYKEEEAVLDNEKLEHVGDALLSAAIVTLLHDLYPAFGPGPATYLRSHMVSNRSLAQIAEQYLLPEMFIAEAHSKYMIQAATKAKGSLFEAYVAGVYYSSLMPREEGPSSTSPSSPSGKSKEGGEGSSEGSGETIKAHDGGTTDCSAPPSSGEGSERESYPEPESEPEAPSLGSKAIRGSEDADSGALCTDSIENSSAEKQDPPATHTRLSTLPKVDTNQEDRKIMMAGCPKTGSKAKASSAELADLGLDDLFSHGLKIVPLPTSPPPAPLIQPNDDADAADARICTTSQPEPKNTSEVDSSSSAPAQSDSDTVIPPTTLPAATSIDLNVAPSPLNATPLSLVPTKARPTHGQAFDHLLTWLNPLFTPIAHFLSSYLDKESSLPLAELPATANTNQLAKLNIPNEWKVEDTLAAGAIAALNQFLGKNYGCGTLPEWIMKKRVMDVWRMVCIVKTPEGKEW